MSAIEELSRLALGLHNHSDPEGTGTTVNVGVVEGGTRYNVIAAEASAEVDVRAVCEPKPSGRGVFSPVSNQAILAPGSRLRAVRSGSPWSAQRR